MARRTSTARFGHSLGILAMTILGVSCAGQAEKRSNASTRSDTPTRSTSAVTPAPTQTVAPARAEAIVKAKSVPPRVERGGRAPAARPDIDRDRDNPLERERERSGQNGRPLPGSDFAAVPIPAWDDLAQGDGCRQYAP